MKKKLCLMLAVMLLLSACGGQKTPETTAQESSTAATESTPVETAAEPTQTETAVPDQMADSPERAAYAAYYDSWLPGSPGSEGRIGDFSPKYVDLDGDGAEEMLIWSARYGFIYEVVVQVDGQTQCVYGGGSYPEDDPTVGLYLCEGNLLEKDCGDLQGVQLNEYYRVQDKQLTMAETVMESADGKFYWSESGGASGLMWTEITEAEYNQIRESYVRVGVPRNPLPENVPGVRDEEEGILLEVIQNQRTFFSEEYLDCTLEEYCQKAGEELGFDVSVTRYAFVDMDGDGVREAVVDFQYGENSQVMCIVMKYVSKFSMVDGTGFYYRQLSNIKEDGSFAYSGGGDNDGWAKLHWNWLTYQWETRQAGDGEGKTDIQWQTYPAAQ